MGYVGTLGGTDVNEEDFLTEQALPALSAWFQSPQAMVGPAARLTTVKFNEIGPTGHYADPSTTHQRQVNYSGGASSSTRYHPLQVAAVLSWRTNDVLRGPASHGRIYSPRPCVLVDAAGDIDGGDRVFMAEAAALLLNTLDTDPGVGEPFRPVIVSTLEGGVMRQIDRVVVDSCLDVHRSRAKSQTKEITSAPVLY